MNLSYWEYKTWLSYIDHLVVGSGITGLNCALALRTKFPQDKILILERGIFPQGASTKNAGFACFGSISEILADLKTHSEEEVRQLAKQRWEGIRFLRQNFEDKAIGYYAGGGHELFLADDPTYEVCMDRVDGVNIMLESVFQGNPFVLSPNTYGFENTQDNYITHQYEGRIDTGMMMEALLQKTRQNNIAILNGVSVSEFDDLHDRVAVKTDRFECKTRKLYLATNGFAGTFLKSKVVPARAQVLVTHPIDKLHIKGTFHMDGGYYYFRNIDNRILLGGGRNLDFEGEETSKFGLSDTIQYRLEELLKTVILPNTPHSIASRWSGIMGVGLQKTPVLKALSANVACGVRLGGMGIAIGSYVGKTLASILD